MCYCGKHKSDLDCDYWDTLTKDPVKGEDMFLRVLFQCLTCGTIYDDGNDGEQGAGYDLYQRNRPRKCQACDVQASPNPGANVPLKG